MLRRRAPELGWAAFAAANLAAMLVFQSWETVPFHFIWVSLTLIYGVRVWRLRPTLWLLVAIQLLTGALILQDIRMGQQEWGELTEVPLMSAMFLAMVWHARRRQDALRVAEGLAEERAALLSQQERFLHDASHELRTPVTIARGHLELLARDGTRPPEVEIALDELARIERIVERQLLLAKVGWDGLLGVQEIDLEAFLEDVFVRWSDVAPRVWRLGEVARGTLLADEESLRIALDALLENAVKYTEPADAIDVTATRVAGGVEISVADEGVGIPADALGRIFERFARADAARTRDGGGAGLGLAIVDAVANAHGGECSVESSGTGARFVLRLPRFSAVRADPLLLALGQPVRPALLEERA
ncbi:MAG: two-component system, OmpR family, sensor kinase [Gaiellaceae bacterium]|nr:two-component system, OmpR family, sensor kinase [Gaiellaceae bacterium]